MTFEKPHPSECVVYGVFKLDAFYGARIRLDDAKDDCRVFTETFGGRFHWRRMVMPEEQAYNALVAGDRERLDDQSSR